MAHLTIYVLVYIDDIIQLLQEDFTFKDLGTLSYFLWVEVLNDDNGPLFLLTKCAKLCVVYQICTGRLLNEYWSILNTRSLTVYIFPNLPLILFMLLLTLIGLDARMTARILFVPWIEWELKEAKDNGLFKYRIWISGYCQCHCWNFVAGISLARTWHVHFSSSNSLAGQYQDRNLTFILFVTRLPTSIWLFVLFE